jgi:hypothetical protein
MYRLCNFFPGGCHASHHIHSSRTGHYITLQFDDGTHGEANLSAELTGPIFEELQDSETFKQAYIDPVLRTVCWPNGADFAPEFLRSLVSEKQVVGQLKS